MRWYTKEWHGGDDDIAFVYDECLFVLVKRERLETMIPQERGDMIERLSANTGVVESKE